jgi:hypothetical protein
MTIDIFDGSYNLVGTSDPFVTATDNWQTVSFADVPFDGTIYAMVHWNMLGGNTTISVQTKTDLMQPITMLVF